MLQIQKNEMFDVKRTLLDLKTDAPIARLSDPLMQAWQYMLEVAQGRRGNFRRFAALAVLLLLLVPLNVVVHKNVSSAAISTLFHLALVAAVFAAGNPQSPPYSLILFAAAIGVVVAGSDVALLGRSDSWFVALGSVAAAWLFMTGAALAQTYFSRQPNFAGGQADALMLALVAAWLGWRALPTLMAGACTLCALLELGARLSGRGSSQRSLAVPIAVSAFIYEVANHVF